MRGRLLPDVESRERYRELFGRSELLEPAVRAVAERHGLAGAPLARPHRGTNVVFAVGDRHFVKLFPPLWPGERAAERASLEHVAGRLSVATPEVAAEGELEGWPYLVLTRVPGVGLESAWSGLAPAARERVARRAGELLAEHHALPCGAPGVPAPPWPAFVRGRAALAPERARASRRARAWEGEIGPFLAPLLPALESAPLAFVNADLTDEHVFVAPDGSGDIVGLVDLADAMVGAREYDFVSFAACLAARAPGLLDAFLDGAAVPRAERGPEIRRRLAAWALLHRYFDYDALLDDALGDEVAPPVRDLGARLWPLPTRR